MDSASNREDWLAVTAFVVPLVLLVLVLEILPLDEALRRTLGVGAVLISFGLWNLCYGVLESFVIALQKEQNR